MGWDGKDRAVEDDSGGFGLSSWELAKSRAALQLITTNGNERLGLRYWVLRAKILERFSLCILKSPRIMASAVLSVAGTRHKNLQGMVGISR